MRRGGRMETDKENHGPMASQEALMTQVPYQSLKAPTSDRFNLQRLASPVLISQPLERPRNRQTKPPDQVPVNVTRKDSPGRRPRELRETLREETAPSTSQHIDQMVGKNEMRPESSWNLQADPAQALEQTRERLPAVGSNEESPLINNYQTEQTKRQETLNLLSTAGRSLWKTRTAAAQFVPRYGAKRPRDQQELIANDASWQPSLIGQPSIKGQLPIQLLDRLSRVADESAESRERGTHDEGSSEDQEVEIPDHGTCSLVEIEPQPNSAYQEPHAQASSVISWESSPEHPAQTRPRLPPDSSPLKFDGPDRSSGQTDQEMRSSPLLAAADLDEGDSVLDSAMSSEAPALVSTQAAMPDAGMCSFDQTDDVSSSVRSREARLEGLEEKVGSYRVRAEHSKTEIALHAATSSLGSVRKVQVSRTPAVQECHIDATDIPCDGRSTFNEANQDDRPLPQTSLSQSCPPTSFIVPGSDIPQPTMEAMSAPMSRSCKQMPVLGPLSPGIDQRVSTEDNVKRLDQPRSEDVSGKRKRQDSFGEKRSKRRKSEAPRGKPIATGTDLDLQEWEIQLRQWRREDIAEQDEQKRLARRQRLGIAGPINDDNSVESTARLLSSRSSVLSIAKHDVSTPFTRSSDYQTSNVDKHHRCHNASKELPADQGALQDTLELFRTRYPSYDGGRTQFNQACEKLRSLGYRAPKPWLWDDFVFRYNNDYLEEYQPRVIAAGELPLPFELFYTENPKKPISLGEVLKDDHLPLPDDSSIRESTQSIPVHPSKVPRMSGGLSLGIGRSGDDADQEEPQLPPRPPQVEATTLTDAVLSKPKIHSQSINHSQDSSVKMWLEKASGAESPELGTPPLAKEVLEVPVLDLEIPASSPAPTRKSRSRRVPWQNSEGRSSSPTQSTPTLASVQISRDEKGKVKIPRRHTENPIRKQENLVKLKDPIVFQKPQPNAEAAFLKLQTNFAELDGRRGITKVPAQKIVDIFSWRK